ncbi:MAG: family 20 glycosylhydrolase [Acidobacteriota bacterium]|nr:family 20 glycosylhydrolase [Acidobacteriota bacterium]
MLRLFLVSLVMIIFTACRTPEQTLGPFKVGFKLKQNMLNGEERFAAEISLKNNGVVPLAGGWKLFFNSIRKIDPGSLPKGLRLEHINGDFFCLSAPEDFAVLNPGDTLNIPYRGDHWLIKNGNAPSGFYLELKGKDGRAFVMDIGHAEITPIEPNQTQRKQGDQLPVPDAASTFAANEKLYELSLKDVPKIIPTPLFVENLADTGGYKFAPDMTIAYTRDVENEAKYLVDYLTPILGGAPKLQEGSEGIIRLKLGKVDIDGKPASFGSEAYRMDIILREGVTITGSDPAGVFYGVQSFCSLITPTPVSGIIPVVYNQRIIDRPRFKYRGMHLDVARNFQPMASVKRMLDIMAFYKLNKFHFHLTDDEGWRLEIPGLPELTEVGGHRGHDPSETTALLPAYGSGPNRNGNSFGSGFYTREQFKEILAYAAARHIEVIPEIDLPGHARAAIVAMKARHKKLTAEGRIDEAAEYLLHDPDDTSAYKSVQGFNDNVVCVGRESTYAFFEKVVDELILMYRESGASLTAVHTGGDEVPRGVWTQSPICQRVQQTLPENKDLGNYFLGRINEILSKRKLKTAGWEEIAMRRDGRGHAAPSPNPAMLDKGLIPYVWNSVTGGGAEDLAYKLANAGYEVVLSNVTNLYFDLAENKHPEEPGFYWAGFLTSRQPWELQPLDMLTGSKLDKMGKPLPPDYWQDHVRLNREARKNILGIQGQLWSETLTTPGAMDYMAYPRILALAERAWAPEPDWAKSDNEAAREEAWNRFANALGQRQLPRLDWQFGAPAYRLPPPGAVIRDGKLLANCAFPGLPIHYTTDGSEPTKDSPRYEGPVAVVGPVALCTLDRNGRGSRIIRLNADGSER